MKAIGPDAVKVQNGYLHFLVMMIRRISLLNFGMNIAMEEQMLCTSVICSMCSQKKDESFQNCIRLRSLATTCEYGKLTDELIKDRIVVGILDENVRKRLLQEQNLPLQLCLDICRAHESSKAQSQAMSSESVVSLKSDPKAWKEISTKTQR